MGLGRVTAIETQLAQHFLAELSEVHEEVVEAGRAFTAGDWNRAADLLVDMSIHARDVAADLRRAAPATEEEAA